MEENKKAFIMELAEVKPHVGTAEGGHPNLLGYLFMEKGLVVKPGQEIHFAIGLNEIQPGGGIEEHYHSNETPYHHVYYVISGQIHAKVGDIEKTVSGDTVIYSYSNVKHSIKNVGKDIAKVLRMDAQREKDDRGTMVQSKNKPDVGKQVTGGTKKAFIVELAEVEPHIPELGHPGIVAFSFVRETIVDKLGQAIHFRVALDEIRPGGGIEQHFHANELVFHHVYYVISGRIQAKVGDIEKTVGSDSVIYCHSNVKHSLKNVGEDIAKVLRISAQSDQDDPRTMVMSK